MDELFGALWIDPVIAPSRWWMFGIALAASMLITLAVSPGRRRYMGALKLAAAQGTQVMVPLAGVFIVRSGFRHAYELQGKSFWDAMWMSLLWMTGFVIIGQLAVRTVPPTSWLLRDLRAANKAVWKDRLGRWFGGGR